MTATPRFERTGGSASIRRGSPFGQTVGGVRADSSPGRATGMAYWPTPEAPVMSAPPVRRDPRLFGVGALLVATVATLGSLTYSLGLGLYPCRLCWYQRVLMYPLVVVLAYGLARGHADVHLPALALSVPGVAVAAYHTYVQLVPSASCGVWGCATVQLRLLGLTIPNQSLLAFVLITGLLVGVGRSGEPDLEI